MNLSGFINEDNATFELLDVNETEQQQQPYDVITLETYYEVFLYVCMTLGIPGNILSAIVWLRLHVASKTSSAVYLAALAVNDLAFLLYQFSLYIFPIGRCDGWLCSCRLILLWSTTTLEPVLVLGFSVERLIAICRPLQVRCI